MRKVIYKDNDFVFESDFNDNGLMFIHCKVFKYNKTTKNKIRLVLNITARKLKQRYVYVAADNKKLVKFIKLFNFSYLKSIPGCDIYRYEVK